jgi:hypothetical protein
MAEICEDIITYLKTVGAVTTLTGSSTSARIYNQDSPPQHAPRSDAANQQIRQALCVTKANDDNVGYMGGRSGLNVADVTITSFAASPAARNALCSAVWDALSPSATGQMGSTYIAEIVCLNRQSDQDALAFDGSDQRIYVATSAYRVWYYQ